jgi:signal transduction histidine kinase/CheY-like chemotaxis protein
LIKDTQSRYITCNDAFAKLVGFDSPSDIVDKTDFDLAWQIPGDNATCFRQGDKIALAGKILTDQEEVLSLPQQLPIVVRVHKRPIIDAEKNVLGILGVAEDITSQKKMEGALSDAQDAAKLAQTAKQTFICNIAHSLRTPLTGMISFTEILSEKLHQTPEGKVLNVVKVAQGQLLVRINQLIEYLATQKSSLLQIKPFASADLSAQIEGLYLPAAQQKGLSLEVVKENLPVDLMGDFTRISTLLLELVSNAIEFTQQGNVKVNLSYRDKTAELIFRISDTGRGFDNDKRTQIFQPFERLKPAYQHDTPGMGLGLPLVNNHLKALGGNIQVESTPGKGSCFIVTLPTKQAPLLPLLIVEDNPMARLFLSSLLESLGYEYDTAEDGKSALEAVKKNSYQLIILDIGLPDISGIEVAKRIHEFQPKQAIVALSAHLYEETKADALAAGMMDAYQKPLSTEKIKELLKKAYSNRYSQ